MIRIYRAAVQLRRSLTISTFVAVGFLHVLHSGDGRGESLGAGADRQCLHLQAGQTARALEVRLLHVPACRVSFTTTFFMHRRRKAVAKYTGVPLHSVFHPLAISRVSSAITSALLGEYVQRAHI